MTQFITLFLSIAIALCSCNYSIASPIDIIKNITKRNKSTKNSTDIIYDILSKGETKIKIIEQDEIDDISNKDYDAYIKGLDISKWNGIVDWESVKEDGIQFIIFRAGYGGKPYSDIYFQKNIEGAIDNGMKIGIYWFSYAYTEEMARNEALQCIKTIEPYRQYITLPVFYDFEYDSVNYAMRNGHNITKSKASSFADVFCKTIKDNGYQSGIYSNIDYAKNYFTEEVMSKYNTWIAQWGNSCTYKKDYIIWQVSDRYYINGKRFDVNYFYYNRY